MPCCCCWLVGRVSAWRREEERTGHPITPLERAVGSDSGWQQGSPRVNCARLWKSTVAKEAFNVVRDLCCGGDEEEERWVGGLPKQEEGGKVRTGTRDSSMWVIARASMVPSTPDEQARCRSDSIGRGGGMVGNVSLCRFPVCTVPTFGGEDGEEEEPERWERTNRGEHTGQRTAVERNRLSCMCRCVGGAGPRGNGWMVQGPRREERTQRLKQHGTRPCHWWELRGSMQRDSR